MLPVNPLFQRDFSAGWQGARKHHGELSATPSMAPAVTGAGNDTVQNALNQAYQKMQAVVHSRLQTVAPGTEAAAVDADTEDYAPQSVADRIVGFIANRLNQEKANGASDERLQSLYQQALKGVEQGLREGRDIIQAQGLYQGDVKDTFISTVGLLADGLQKLGEDMFGSAPATPATGDSGTGASQSTGFSASMTQVQVERSRSFEMEVVTQEGDRVKIQVGSGQSLSSTQVGYSDANAVINGFEANFSSYDNFSFSVEGDLNQSELAALNDLFGQVNSVADTFYGGDVEQAFNQALDIGMNPEQLAGFAVNMNQSETVSVREAYASVQNMAGPVRHNPHQDMFDRLAEFADKVKQGADAVRNLENAPLNAQSLYGDLISQLHSDNGRHSDHRHGHHQGHDHGDNRGDQFKRFTDRAAS